VRRQPLIWTALRLFTRLCDKLPHAGALALGDLLGRTVKNFSPRRAAKATARCARVLGVPEPAAREIVSKAYSHFGRALAEFIRLPKMCQRLDELIEIRGEENIRRAMELGRGVILLSAHIGQWEYAAALLARRGMPIHAIGAKQRDDRITRAISDTRMRAGVTPLGKGLDLRGSIECLKKGGILAVLLDQDARDTGVISPFLGQPASTPVGPIKLARKFGCPVVPTHIVRNSDGVHMTMTVEPPLEGPNGRPFGEDLQYAADRCNEVISGWIRENPGQWLWMYPRWASTLNDK
jgi:KDO2-lipid IV(A) lauroyltransferase